MRDETQNRLLDALLSLCIFGVAALLLWGLHSFDAFLSDRTEVCMQICRDQELHPADSVGSH